MSLFNVSTSTRLAGSLTLVLGIVPALFAQNADTPVPVSPHVPSGQALVETSCPTFSFAGVESAESHELVVYRVSPLASEREPTSRLAVRTILPGEARAWTPTVGQCLEGGARYAWSVRAVFSLETGAWSEPALFRVAEGPTLDEVEAALATLEKFLHRSENRAARPTEKERELEGNDADPPMGRRTELEPLTDDSASPILSFVPPPVTTDDLRSASAASVPTLGAPSLTVDANIALGAASNLFKNGDPYLWNDGSSLGVGPGALSSSSGAGNTAVGVAALETNSTGLSNTAVGTSALRDNTGSRNTAVGRQALQSNTTGGNNTAVGRTALLSNGLGSENTAIGAEALFSSSGSFNTAVGSKALHDSTGGQGNTAVGAEAMDLNATGIESVAVGYRALADSATSYSVAVGAYAAEGDVGNGGNVGVGHEALRNVSEGYGNVALGNDALKEVGFGFNNVAIGVGALDSCFADDFIVGGNCWLNVAIGEFAGSDLLHGSDNIFIGTRVDGITSESETIRIGDSTHEAAYIGGIYGATAAGGASVVVNSAGKLGTTTSSRRFKQDIEDLDVASRSLLSLRPVRFRYRPENESGAPGPIEYGLIAEEVVNVLPELVTLDGANRPHAVRYHLLLPMLLDELKSQASLLEEQSERIAELEDRLFGMAGSLPVDTVDEAQPELVGQGVHRAQGQRALAPEEP